MTLRKGRYYRRRDGITCRVVSSRTTFGTYYACQRRTGPDGDHVYLASECYQVRPNGRVWNKGTCVFDLVKEISS